MREDINLGRKLTEAHANMGKIALRTLLLTEPEKRFQSAEVEGLSRRPPNTGTMRLLLSRKTCI